MPVCLLGHYQADFFQLPSRLYFLQRCLVNRVCTRFRFCHLRTFILGRCLFCICIFNACIGNILLINLALCFRQVFDIDFFPCFHSLVNCLIGNARCLLHDFLRLLYNGLFPCHVSLDRRFSVFHCGNAHICNIALFHGQWQILEVCDQGQVLRIQLNAV